MGCVIMQPLQKTAWWFLKKLDIQKEMGTLSHCWQEYKVVQPLLKTGWLLSQIYYFNTLYYVQQKNNTYLMCSIWCSMTQYNAKYQKTTTMTTIHNGPKWQQPKYPMT